MNNIDIKNNYLMKIKENIELNNIEGIDYILEFMYSGGIEQEILEKIDDILHELTLYAEFRENEYKINVLKMIDDFN